MCVGRGVVARYVLLFCVRFVVVCLWFDACCVLHVVCCVVRVVRVLVVAHCARCDCLCLVVCALVSLFSCVF